MDIDGADLTNSFSAKPDKGKTVMLAGNPSHGGKASLWVEKNTVLSPATMSLLTVTLSTLSVI